MVTFVFRGVIHVRYPSQESRHSPHGERRRIRRWGAVPCSTVWSTWRSGIRRRLETHVSYGCIWLYTGGLSFVMVQSALGRRLVRRRRRSSQPTASPMIKASPPTIPPTTGPTRGDFFVVPGCGVSVGVKLGDEEVGLTSRI